MKTDPGRIWINTGLLLLTAALFLWAYNGQESRRAGDSAQQVITELTQSLTQQPPAEAGAEAEQEEAPAVKLPEYLLDAQREMPEKTVDGRDYIGVLSIPTLQLELPVLSRWSYPNLKEAPCRYSGSLYQNNHHLRPQLRFPFRQAQNPPTRGYPALYGYGRPGGLLSNGRAGDTGTKRRRSHDHR